MIEIILAFLGCAAVCVLGSVLAFFGALGNDVKVYISGIVIICAGVFFTGYEIYKLFAH